MDLCRVGLGTKGTWWGLDENKGKLMGPIETWWEQKEFNWNWIGTKGFWWVIDGNKRNLIRINWELNENKKILMSYWWEQEELNWNSRNLMRIQPPTPSKNKKHPLTACWCHPIGSPHMLYPKVLKKNLRIGAAHVWNCFLTYWLRQREKIRWTS